MLDRDFQQTVWDEYIDIAEEFNDPGVFTTIIGYEWTSTENGNNLHRNVLYRDDGEAHPLLSPNDELADHETLQERAYTSPIWYTP